MNRTLSVCAASLALAALVLSPSVGSAQIAPPNALTFQGRLATPSGNPVPDGTYNLRFYFYDAAMGGTLLYEKPVENVPVKNGTFATIIDGFTADKFNGNVWLGVKIGMEAELTPRTKIVSVPYALKSTLALTVPDGSITGAKLAAGTLTADKFASGAFNTIAWLLGGNSGTNHASQFLGTTDNQPLVFKTNNTERMRMNADGRVGIGIATPGQILHVAGGNIQIDGGKMIGQNPADAFTHDDDSVGHYSLGWYADTWNTFGNTGYLTGYGGLKFFTGGAPRVAITQAGKVGIGMTTPVQTLDINGGLHMGGGVIQKGGAAITTTSDLGLYARTGSEWLRLVTNNAPIRLFTNTTDGIANNPTNDATMSVVGTSVGINKNNPATALDVNGTATITGFKLPTGAGAGKALISDAAGTGTWGQLGTAGIADAAITGAKVAAGTLTADKFAPGVLSGQGWQLTGNSGVTSGFLGTTDTNPLEFRVNNVRVMRYTSNATSVNVLGGSPLNYMDSGVTGGTIAGGGRDNATGNDFPNEMYGSFGTIGGGYGNLNVGFGSTIAGGLFNTTYFLSSGAGSAESSTIAGGIGNTVTGYNAAIVGGNNNFASGTLSTIGGGNGNVAGVFSVSSYVAGGDYATVPGGRANTASGNYSFAAGRRAKANHDGAFAWADSTDADFASTVANQFNIRAAGGARIFSNAGATTGVLLAAGGGSWSSASDRNLKTNFQNVDTLDVLEKLAALPITSWNYKANGNIRHLGVMAQDFWAAFGGLGMDDKHIDTVDADGVAFAAIQGLNRKLEQSNAALKAKNAELEAMLKELAARVDELEARQKK